MLYIDACHEHYFNTPTPVPPTNALAQETLVPGVMKFTIFVDPSVVIIIIYMFLIFSDPCPRVERKTRNIAFSVYD